VIVRFRPIVALLLLALWLPATQHCDLEAAGLLHDHLHHHCTGDCATPHSDDACGTDHCPNIEGNNYRPASDSLKVDAPMQNTLADFYPLSAVIAVASVSADISRTGPPPPPELAPTWRFIMRAALPARAPDSAV
jgi:hypothetical protein